MSKPGEDLPIKPWQEGEVRKLGLQIHAMGVRKRLETIMKWDGIEKIVETATQICERWVGISAIMIAEQKTQMMQMDAVLSGMNNHQKTQFVMWQLAIHPEETALAYPWRPEHEDKMTEAYYTMIGYMVENGLFDVSSLKIDCYEKLWNIYSLIDKIIREIDSPEIDVLIETLKKELVDFWVDAGALLFLLPENKFEALSACLALWTITKVIEGTWNKKFSKLENRTKTIDGHGFSIWCDQVQPLAFMISLEFLLPDWEGASKRNDFTPNQMKDFINACLGKLLTPDGKNFHEICFWNAMESLIIRTNSEPVDTDAEKIKKLMRGNLGE